MSWTRVPFRNISWRTTSKLSSVNSGKTVSNAELLGQCEEVNNKNPRNLELLRIARKPTGYEQEKQTREWWHKFVFIDLLI